MLLCDFAQVAAGKLYISGGGWSITGPGPSASAIAMKLDIPWDRTNKPTKMELRLFGEDGQPVMQPGPLGDQPIEIKGEFEVGRPPGLKPGTPIDFAFAVNIPPLPLSPGRRYTWQLWLDGSTDEAWTLSFQTRDVAPQQG